MQYSTLGVLVTVLHHQKNQNRLFGMAITIKHKYKLDNKDTHTHTPIRQ